MSAEPITADVQVTTTADYFWIHENYPCNENTFLHEYIANLIRERDLYKFQAETNKATIEAMQAKETSMYDRLWGRKQK
jgi:hypothetical protein